MVGGGVEAGERAAPVWMLTEAMAGLQAELARAWPEARVEVLPAAEADEVGINFCRVLERVQACARERAGKQAILLVAAEGRDDGLAAACVGLFRTARLELPRLEAKVVRVMARANGGATEDAAEPARVLTADHADLSRQGCRGVFGLAHSFNLVIVFRWSGLMRKCG